MTAVADVLTRLVEAGTLPGCVALVGRDDAVDVTVVGAQGIGGAPMREDSLFRIASIGKPITAAAVLALVADGQLELEDPVATWLPELAEPRVLRSPSAPLDDTVPVNRAITVADLLRSTNGHGFSSDFTTPVATVLAEQLNQGPPRPQSMLPPDEWMAVLSGVPLVHQPGEGFTYNTAFDVLGVLVSRVTGAAFADHLRDRIFGPLGMHDTGFTWPHGAGGRTTTAYRRDEHGALVVVDEGDGQWSSEPPFASGGGGLASSAGDLWRFQQMLLDRGGDVLPAALVDAMMSDQLTPAIRATDTAFLNGQSWGYGGGVDIAVAQPWNVPGRFGWVGGTGTSAYAVPADGSVAILLTQVELGGPDGGTVMERFWAAAAADLGHAPR